MFVKRLAMFAFMLLMSGCANMGYYLQAANGQMDVIGHAQPIERVLSDPTAAASLKQKLDEVLHIREFASKELGLPDNGSFRRYADLKRPFVVWNVFAAPEFSIKPKDWCYLMFGCANYRGYFSRGEAETVAQAMQREGYDIYIGGVPAYSTLGWFDDPVLNTFIHYPEAQLAALIFHELAHQIAYVSDDTVFNESFAVALELEATRRWLVRNGTEEKRAAFEAFQMRKEAFTALVHKYRERLGEIYASNLPDEEKRAQKAEAFYAMRADYGRLKLAWGGVSGYDKWFSQDLNNAQLASVSLYTQLVPAFQALLAQSGGDLPSFYDAVKNLSRLSKAERLTALRNITEAKMGKLPSATLAPFERALKDDQLDDSQTVM